MSADDSFVHHVCTHDQARAIIAAHKHMWVSNCGCRKDRGHCARSRIDLCLAFREDALSPSTGRRAIGAQQAGELLREAQEKRLVTRPFSLEANRSLIEGICFCCDDCCAYFVSPDVHCDAGTLVESTDLDACVGCGDCVGVCHFHARSRGDGQVTVNRSACYGCGLCAEACSQHCITMMPRTG